MVVTEQAFHRGITVFHRESEVAALSGSINGPQVISSPIARQGLSVTVNRYGTKVGLRPAGTAVCHRPPQAVQRVQERVFERFDPSG